MRAAGHMGRMRVVRLSELTRHARFIMPGPRSALCQARAFIPMFGLVGVGGGDIHGAGVIAVGNSASFAFVRRPAVIGKEPGDSKLVGYVFVDAIMRGQIRR